MRSRRVRTTVAAAAAALLMAEPAVAAPGDVERVSLGPGGTQAALGGAAPSVSADGRHVAFASEDDALVPDDGNGFVDVFVRDRETGETRLVSRGVGGQDADDQSGFPDISADGRFVAFYSEATNLVDDDVGVAGTYVADLATGAIERVSLDDGGDPSLGGALWGLPPSISQDGRYVAFVDYGELTMDTPAGNQHIFVRDRTAADTRFVTDFGYWPTVSDDGRVVAFTTTRELVAADANGVPDVYVRTGTDAPRLVTASTAGGAGNGQSDDPEISGDGRFVAFESFASDLVAGDANAGNDVFVHELATGETEIVSLTADGAQVDALSRGPSISADGSVVAFDAAAALSGCGEERELFIRDRTRAITYRASRTLRGLPADGASSGAAVSASGGHVAFASEAANLVDGDTNGAQDVFVGELGDLADPPVVAVADARADEDAGTLSFPVTVCRPHGSDGPVAIDYATDDGTATAGADHEAAAGTLVVPAGEAAGSIDVTVVPDGAEEPGETVYLDLSSAAALERTRVRGVIADDDLAAQPGPIVFERGAEIWALEPGGEPAPLVGGRDPAVSRDGTRLAWVEGEGTLRVGAIDGTGARTLHTAARIDGPAWSPDGGRVAFVEGTAIRVVDTETGAVETLAGGLPVLGNTLSWSPDGTLIAFDRGSACEPFCEGPDPDAGLATVDLDSGEVRRLRPGRDPAYGPDGSIAFEHEGRIQVLEPDGDATPIGAGARPSFSPDGTRVVWEQDGSIVSAAPGDPAAPVVHTSGADHDPTWARRLGAQLSIADAATVDEGDTLAFTLRLDAVAREDVVVTLATGDGTAASPADFAARSSVEVTIREGSRTAVFEVETVDDAVDEPDETLSARITAADGAAIADATATGTIVDDDAPPEVSVHDAGQVGEGGALRFPVRLSVVSGRAVTVKLSTADVSAVAPGDYEARSQVEVVIPAGRTEAGFEVQTVDDAVDEGDETVQARIVAGSNASPGTTAAVGTIVDDEVTPEVSVYGAGQVAEGDVLRFTVGLSEVSNRPVTVRVSTSDVTAVAPGDYAPLSQVEVVIAAGDVGRVFRVQTVDDAVDEGDETVQARIVAGTNASPGTTVAVGTIVDDEVTPEVSVHGAGQVGEGGVLRFPVRLSQVSNRPVTVRLSTADASAVAPGDYGARSSVATVIPAGQAEALFEVQTVDDALDEGDETVRARIVAGTNSSPGATVAVGTIADDDGPLARGRVVLEKLRGSVRVRRGGGGFHQLEPWDRLRTGTVVDARRGKLTLYAKAGQATLSRGVFRIVRRRRADRVVLRLLGAPGGRAAAAARRRRRARLWADVDGRFQVRARHARVSARGAARWLTKERRRGTLVRVREGAVRVRAAGRRRGVRMEAPRSKLVRRRR